MDRELVEKTAASRLTRRKIVTTGTKLAYAAQLVAASFKLTAAGALAEDWVLMEIILCGDPRNEFCADPEAGIQDAQCKALKTVICHRTCSEEGGELKNGFNAIEIRSGDTCDPLTPDQALAAHLAQHPHVCQGGRQDELPRVIVEDQKLAECPGGVGGLSPV